MSLQEWCIRSIVEHGIPTDPLPEILKDEILRFYRDQCMVRPLLQKRCFELVNQHLLPVAFWRCFPRDGRYFQIRDGKGHSPNERAEVDWGIYDSFDGWYYSGGLQLFFKLKVNFYHPHPFRHLRHTNDSRSPTGYYVMESCLPPEVVRYLEMQKWVQWFQV